MRRRRASIAGTGVRGGFTLCSATYPLVSVFSAPITPHGADGAHDLDALPPRAEFELAQGTHGFH